MERKGTGFCVFDDNAKKPAERLARFCYVLPIDKLYKKDITIFTEIYSSHYENEPAKLGADSEMSVLIYDENGNRYFSKGGHIPNDEQLAKPVSAPFPGCGAAITSSSRNIEFAVKYLDFFYGEQGHLLSNFGVEGESYTTVDGKSIYTEAITKNENGLSMSQAMAMYQRAYSSGPFIQDVGYIEQYYALPQ